MDRYYRANVCGKEVCNCKSVTEVSIGSIDLPRDTPRLNSSSKNVSKLLLDVKVKMR